MIKFKRKFIGTKEPNLRFLGFQSFIFQGVDKILRGTVMNLRWRGVLSGWGWSGSGRKDGQLAHSATAQTAVLGTLMYTAFLRKFWHHGNLRHSFKKPQPWLPMSFLIKKQVIPRCPNSQVSLLQGILTNFHGSVKHHGDMVIQNLRAMPLMDAFCLRDWSSKSGLLKNTLM